MNLLDAITGDGDCGSTTKSGAIAVGAAVKHANNSPSFLLFKIAQALEDEMGGSSGSLLSLLFTAFAAHIRVNNESVKLSDLTEGFNQGISAMMEVGRAAQGDRLGFEPGNTKIRLFSEIEFSSPK